MKYFSRRSVLKALGASPLLLSLGCARKVEGLLPPVDPSPEPDTKTQTTVTARELSRATKFQPGYLSIVQGPTSNKEALFNIFAPRLKKYTYEVSDELGSTYLVKHYEKVLGPGFHNVDKIRVSGLSLGSRYTLRVIDGKTIVDERTFSALDISNPTPNFALISCMPDDYRFTTVIDPMWERLRKEKPDFLILNGDTVYVDSFEFVERKKATEFDIWQRYTDSLRRIPLYHWLNLVPVFTTWDDHDFGTNDGDRDFVAKEAAAKLFRAIFGGEDLPGVWEQGPGGVSSTLTAFGQRFYFMDDRSFRQPNKNQTSQEPFGHWGESQHEWLLQNISSDSSPSWIINGNQCFNGVALDFKESFESNHPKEFADFIKQLSQIKTPVVFGSGDVHLSEVMRIPKNVMGYETYEFTSSSMHSYTGDGWDNPMRVSGAYTIEHNFFMVRSRNDKGALQVNIRCLGLPAKPYFEKSFLVKTN